MRSSTQNAVSLAGGPLYGDWGLMTGAHRRVTLVMNFFVMPACKINIQKRK
jgi:hypothetical protein